MPELWIGSGSDPEPPASVLRLRGEDGNEMVRLAIPCGYCGGYGATWWMWRHNGNMDCWLDMDSVGTLTEQRDHEDAAKWWAVAPKKPGAFMEFAPPPKHRSWWQRIGEYGA